jgi:hypothetical protein
MRTFSTLRSRGMLCWGCAGDSGEGSGTREVWMGGFMPIVRGSMLHGVLSCSSAGSSVMHGVGTGAVLRVTAK